MDTPTGSGGSSSDSGANREGDAARYTPPAGDTSGGGYTPPSSGTGGSDYTPPSSGSSYTPPSSGSGYTPPSSGTGGSDYTPPAGGGYQPPPPAGYGGGYPPAGYGGRPNPPGPMPENNLVMAIISIFCCWPLAIPAIIFSTQVQSKWSMGDFAGAQEAANKAKTFSMIAIILGLAVTLLYIIFVFVLGASMFSFSTTNFTP